MAAPTAVDRAQDGRGGDAHRHGSVKLTIRLDQLSEARKSAAVQAQAAIHYKRFNSAMDAVVQGVALFDADMRLITCNRRYAEIYGLPAEIANLTLGDDIVVAWRADPAEHALNDRLPVDRVFECVADVLVVEGRGRDDHRKSIVLVTGHLVDLVGQVFWAMNLRVFTSHRSMALSCPESRPLVRAVGSMMHRIFSTSSNQVSR